MLFLVGVEPFPCVHPCPVLVSLPLLCVVVGCRDGVQLVMGSDDGGEDGT